MGSESEEPGFGTSLLLGLVVVVIAMQLPLVGGALHVLVLLTGLGLLIEAAVYGWQASLDDEYAGA